jgi:hypothetical protein
VADHDEVVDLRPLADPGRLERPAIDRAVGADLDVVADLQAPGVGDLLVPAVEEPVFEAVSAQDGPGVDLDPLAQEYALVEDGVRVQGRALAPTLQRLPTATPGPIVTPSPMTASSPM